MARDDANPSLPTVPRQTWIVAVALAFWLVAMALQWASRAYQQEFGAHADEPAHFVTGLMVRDYLLSGFHWGPMTYANDYYQHYPKVALGNWPPGFYVMQSVWTLVLGVSRPSMLIFMALLAALVASMIFAALRRWIGTGWAVLAGGFWLLLPLTRLHTSQVMVDLPVVLPCLAAMLLWLKWMQRPRPGVMLLFSLMAAAGILTKGNALSLILVPLGAITATGQWKLLKRIAPWLGVAGIALMAGPWTWHFRDVARAGWDQARPTLDYTGLASVFFARATVQAVGLVAFLFAVWGAWSSLRPARPLALRALAGACVGQIVGCYVLQLVIPCGLEDRHLLPATTALVILLAMGAHDLYQRLRAVGVRQWWSTAIVGLIIIGPFGLWTFSAAIKSCSGFGPAAAMLLSFPPAQRILVCSDAIGEGQCISELAMREPVRPAHTIVRASKLLASSTWSGGDYKLRVGSQKELVKLLKDQGIVWVVVDSAVGAGARQAHHDLMERLGQTLALRGQRIYRGDSERNQRRYVGAIGVYYLSPAGEGP